ncbi:hypothetical protein [Croceivirga thetidis]|uniref:DUF4476 domain-containing protein n=1 Tax=Croceivirga thetidis TaxID=2721623 RepID=A0ABX1GMZ0_9FLAO|nr:hypothetical protein [Croceivirga thetidis]NKI31023.1 hypothetical protein [Croceivirga thetidis]
MEIKIRLFIVLVFTCFCISAQTAKEKRDSSISKSRSKHLVERFEKTVVQPKLEIKEKIRKSKARRQAILWYIDNSGLKENQKNKLRKALDKQSKSSFLIDFIVKNEEGINQFVEETTDS